MNPSNPIVNKPTIIVIFGITGDLAGKKLLPALYHLYREGLLHHQTKIVGLSRRDIDVDKLLDKIELCVLETDNVCDPATLDLFKSNLRMVQFDPHEDESYPRLKHILDDIEDDFGFCVDRLLYLSVPPRIYRSVIEHLGEHGFASGCIHGTGKSRLLVEKPFGFDLTSATRLIEETNQYFDEEQIFRIDHYLAKGTAQNILTFRLDNPLFAGVWNNRHVSRIEVTADETIGIEGRGEFYDGVGALRDLIQSHLLQLLALTTLELPEELNETSLHAAKAQLLNALTPLDTTAIASRVQRGQYKGYRQDAGNPDSTTETYVRLELTIDNERWRDTQIVLRTGKKLGTKHTDIRLIFDKSRDERHNTLRLRLQPDEGIDINLRVEAPGYEHRSIPAVLDYDYRQAAHPDAYERVLVDALHGDHALFASSEEVLASWRFLQPILDAWEHSSRDLIIYEPGRLPQ